MSYSANETNDIDKNAAYVRGVSAPVDTDGEVIRRRGVGRIKGRNEQVTTSNEVVVAEEDASNRREEDGISAEVDDEVVGRREEVPDPGSRREVVLSRLEGERRVKICQGHMARPTAAQMYPPRRIFRYRGSRAVMSVPAEIEFAAILVPSCAKANADAITKTPKRVAPSAFSRKRLNRSKGFQIGLP